MKHRLSHYALAALLAVSSKPASALEVGEIQVQSALNQLFDATIPLPTLAPEDLNGISIKIASPAMFNEFGLERSATLAHLVFSIQYDAEGRVYVKAVSTQPIREPSLALLLEFSWPRGKTFREFTVLLDPVRRLAERPSSRSKTVLNTRETPEIAAMPSYKPGDFYGPVLAGEGLWGIALKLRPEGITREQMMQALFQVNPQAFANGNVAGLKTGVKLRIPTYKEIADITGAPIAIQLAALEAGPPPPAADNTPQNADTPITFPLRPSIIPEPVAIAAAPTMISPTPPTPDLKATAPLNLAGASAAQLAIPLPSIVASEFLLDAEQSLLAALSANRLDKIPLMPVIPVADSTLPVASVAVAEDEQKRELAVVNHAPLPDNTQIAQTDTSALFISTTVADNILEEASQLLAQIAPSATIEQTILTVQDAESAAPLMQESPAKPAPNKQVDEAASILLPILDLDIASDAMQLLASVLPAPTLKITPLSRDKAKMPAPVSDATHAAKPAPVPSAHTPQAVKTVEADKAGKEYGPVANNERLWDIAGKVSPNSNLGRDVVMRALFVANPQAFAKPNMDSLKVGAMLRIPTAEEIAKHTAIPEVKAAPEATQQKPQQPSHKNK